MTTRPLRRLRAAVARLLGRPRPLRPDLPGLGRTDGWTVVARQRHRVHPN